MSSTYSSVKSTPLTKKDLMRAIKYLEKNNRVDEPMIVKVSFNKIPDEIKKLRYAARFGMSIIYGIPLFEDKDVPKDECWLKDSNGQIIKLKI
jgi:hypothetical protein